MIGCRSSMSFVVLFLQYLPSFTSFSLRKAWSRGLCGSSLEVSWILILVQGVVLKVTQKQRRQFVLYHSYS